MYIYLVGKPCSGKDTISRFIIDEYGFKHICVGKLVGEHISNVYGSESDELKKFYSGYIVDNEIANKIINPIVLKKVNGNLLFDGFPRTKTQFDSHINVVEKSIKKLFIVLNLSDAEATRRMEKRVVCSVCTKSQINEEQSVCKFCMSSGLYKRKDDYVEAMAKRLEEFANKTSYIFNIKNNKDLNIYIHFVNVDGKKVEEVLEEIDFIVQETC